MKYVYPAILYPDDDKIGVTVPDLPGCHTFGDGKADALLMAKDAVEMWLWNAENTAMLIPSASENLPITEPDGTLTLIAADTGFHPVGRLKQMTGCYLFLLSNHLAAVLKYSLVVMSPPVFYLRVMANDAAPIFLGFP